MKKIDKINGIALCVIGLIVVIGAIALMISQSNKTKEDVKVKITGSKIAIEGQFGTTIDAKDISEIKLLDTLPTIGTRVNGAESGEYKRGDFKVDDLGTCKLFINLKNGPFIYIEANDKYIINFNDKTKTLDVYDKLKEAIK
ncbi:hypothetical protein CFOLD11_12960 [Clostridium folliculivorans]|uniref:Bacterial Pleckstrin homology domain-containing protein n=1 Tax=Clostridium folliculivorans TaxID=2886038 RepID=A0A9W5Y0V3_9CLOT|nr:hypothetical protein [Clostridium folliculivorans]GKU24470.1 hypothetical protein CFOLD11_12960 [Clostridium folliculivorans]